MASLLGLIGLLGALTLVVSTSALRRFAELERTRAAIASYLSLPDRGIAPISMVWVEALDRALAGASSLVDLNVVQARDAGKNAARTDSMANVIGIVTVVLLLVGIALVVCPGSRPSRG